MKKRNALAAILSTFVLTVCSADAAKAPATPPPTTDEQKTLYAIGVLVSQTLQRFELNPEELAQVQKGIADGVAGTKPLVDPQEYMTKVQALQQARMTAATERSNKAGAEFLAKAAAEPGVTKTASGMVIKQTKPGTGASPAATDNVKVHYEGRLVDGKVFDSSIARGEPATFPLNGGIACWTE